MTKSELNAAVDARLQQIETALSTLDDSTAVDMTTLFPVWAEGVYYPVDYRAQDQDELYKCVQAHTSQAGWEPHNVPALWTKIAKPGEIPVWKQPTGAQDTYMTGDKVHYPGESDPVYVSAVDNNVWPPDVYGWVLDE